MREIATSDIFKELSRRCGDEFIFIGSTPEGNKQTKDGNVGFEFLMGPDTRVSCVTGLIKTLIKLSGRETFYRHVEDALHD